MQIFDRTRLENTFLRREARSLFKAGFISKEQKEFIDAQLPAYKEQNILIRIGLFILGCLFYASCCGLFAFITLIGGNEHFGWTFLVYAVFGFVVLEFVIKNWEYYGNGLDDAFLICAQVCLWVAVGFLCEDLNIWMLLFLMAAIVGSACCLRYVDRLSALIACIGLTAFVVNFCVEAGGILRSFLPFIIMLLAFGIYKAYRWLEKKAGPDTLYKSSLHVIFMFALLLFYLGGNYFVVREASQELMHMELLPGEDIPLAFIFYGLTFLVPLAYIYFSLVSKNRSLLWIGLLTLAFSVFSIRYYYHFMSVEVALILGGAMLFALSFYAMRKLRGKESGLTYEQDRFLNGDEMANAEVLVLLQRYAVKPGSHQEPGVEFGGGEFGGGGSGNKF